MPRSTNQADISTTIAPLAEHAPNALAEQTRWKVLSTRRKYWGRRTFRFSPTSFRLGAKFSIRRFSMTEAVILFSMAYITSKILGVIRQVLFNSMFGTGPQATAYIAAFNLPDTISNLIAGGALSAALIPVFISYERQQGAKELWRLISLVFNLLLVISTICIFLAECFAPELVNNLLIPGLPLAERALTTSLTRIMLLHTLILGIGTVITAILNSKRQFLLPALSIAIYDLGLIGGLLFSFAIPHLGIYGPTLGLLVSGVCQVAVLIPALFGQGVHYTFVWDLKHPGLREIMSLLGPNILALGIATLTSIIDTAFASYLPDKASIAAMKNAVLFYGLPSIFLVQAVGQSLLPQITLQATQKQYLRMSQTIFKVVGGVVLLSIPASLCLYFFGKPAIHIFFQHGTFTAHSTSLTYLALIGYALALPGLTATSLLGLCFYAMKDAKTPLFTNLGILAVHIGSLILLVRIFTAQYSILAISLTSAVAGTIEATALTFLLVSRLRARIKMDKGFQRLCMQRLRAKHSKTATNIGFIGDKEKTL